MRTVIKKILSPFLKKGSELWLKKPRKYTYRNVWVWVQPGVFPPFLTISTKLLLDFLDTASLKRKSLLELGCGCGIISIFAAKKGAEVTATDINPTALDALKDNAKANNIWVSVRFSDLFVNLAGMAFDYIIINPPYYPKAPQSVAEEAWFCGENFEYFEMLFAQLPRYITPDNCVYMVLSEDCALQHIQLIAAKNGIRFGLALEKKVAGEKNYIFRLTLG